MRRQLHEKRIGDHRRIEAQEREAAQAAVEAGHERHEVLGERAVREHE